MLSSSVVMGDAPENKRLHSIQTDSLWNSKDMRRVGIPERKIILITGI